MKKIYQKYIDQTVLFSRNAIAYSFLAIVLFGVFGLLPQILNKSGIVSNNWSEAYGKFMKPVFGIALFAFFLFTAIVIALSMFTSDSKNERDADDIESPLMGLTSEQQKRIIALLKEKGAPQKGDGKMYRAGVAYILNALKDLGYIPATVDDNILRLWVVKETGYKEDDLAHFRESMGRSKKNNMALRTKEMIEEMLSKGA